VSALRASPGPILLVGAAGQLGVALAEPLAERGTVVRITRRELDLERPDDIRTLVRAIRPSLIVNAAAYTAVDAAESDRERCARINAGAPGVLAQEASRIDAVLIHYSTNYVFDGRQAEPYTEEAPTAPLSVYGATKAEGEAAIAAASGRHLILRTAALYAAGTRNFMTRMLELANERDELRVVDDQFVSPTPAWLLAEATCSAIARVQEGRELLGIHHVTTRGRASWYSFAVRVLALDPARSAHRVRSITPVASTDYDARAQRPVNGVLDVTRFEQFVGARLCAWDVALERTLLSATARA
jgi:dTDP-4-dehydrorhamnose reductase